MGKLLPKPKRVDPPSPEEEEALEREHDFHEALERNRYWFRSSLSDSKPVVDYLAALSLNAALAAVFFSLGNSMQANGWSDRKALAMGLIFIIWYKLIRPLMAATDSAVEIGLLYLAKKLGMPFPDKIKSATLRALWLGTTLFISIIVPLGTGLIGHELAKGVAELSHRATAPANTSKSEPMNGCDLGGPIPCP